MILENLLTLALIAVSFIAGVKMANWYNAKALQEIKDALERQFVRLRANADADDPGKPYLSPQTRFVPQQPIPNAGDFDGDKQPIPPEFMEHLKQNGQAVTQLRKHAK